ncbi:MAG: dockerin type I domain-containing protein [Candidatus Woesearchaeota archaeon]
MTKSQCIAGDLNCDKKVDIFDLVLVAQNYGKTSGFDVRADANKDGEVNIFDLVLVAQNYGKAG